LARTPQAYLGEVLNVSITYDEFKTRWKDLNYVFHVLALASALNADGCSGVTEYYHLGCLEHDIAYRTGFDPLGLPVDKAEADKRFRWYMNSKSRFGRLGPMAYWRYYAVKWFGDKSWNATIPFPDVTFLNRKVT
jgi:hypothetical protein